MAVCFTECEDCGFMALNVMWKVCMQCKSDNVFVDYDHSDYEEAPDADSE